MNKRILLFGFVLLLFSSLVCATTDFTTNNVLWVAVNPATVSIEEFTGKTLTNNGVTVINSNEMNFVKTESDHLSISDNDELSFTDGGGNDDPYTMVLWVKLDDPTKFRALYKGDASNIEYVLTTTGVDKFVDQNYLPPGVSNWIGIESNNIFNSSNLYQIITTYSGSENPSGFKMYLDGGLISTTGQSGGTYTGMSNTATNLLIGQHAAASDFADGQILYVALYAEEFNSSKVSELYTLGETYNPYISPDVFELTAENGYNSTLIIDFNATFINSTDTTFFQSTNGTIEYNKNETVNITVESENYFNRTYINFNTSNNLKANLTQTNITFNFIFNNTLTPITTPINVTDLTTGLTFISNNGSLNIPPNANEYLNFNFSCFLDIFIPRNITFNFNTREISNYTIELEPTLVNLTFKDATTDLGIYNATINIKYPSGAEIEEITDANGNILFSYVYNNQIEFGNYNITFGGTEGFISPISFVTEINSTNIPFEKEFNISQANLIINIYDREDNSLFIGKDVEIFMQGVFNETISTGQLIISNLTIVEGSYTLISLSDGYFTEQKTVDFTNKENLSIDFYMLNITGDNSGSHFVTVINEFFIEQPDTVVELLEVDLVTNTAKKVSECLANNNGECFFGIELGVKKYVFTGTKTIDGILNTDTTNPEGVFINIDNDITKLFLKLRDDYVSSAITDLNIAINNNLQNIRDNLINTTNINISFSTDSGSSTIICLDYYTFLGNDKTLDSYQCVNSDSGIITNTKTLNRSNNYNIEVYQVENNLKILYFTENILSINSFEKIADSEEWLSPLVLVPYILLLAFTYWARRIMWFWIGTIVISWSLLAWLPSIMMTSVVLIITFVCLFEMKISMKKRIEI